MNWLGKRHHPIKSLTGAGSILMQPLSATCVQIRFTPSPPPPSPVVYLNCALSSGAPPVMSTVVSPGVLAMSSTQRSAVRRSIISVLRWEDRGEAYCIPTRTNRSSQSVHPHAGLISAPLGGAFHMTVCTGLIAVQPNIELKHFCLSPR